MKEKIFEWIVGFGKLQIGFWLLVYEVIIYVLKGVLQPYLKYGLEKRVQIWPDLEKKARHNKGEEPRIRIIQKFSNLSNFELNIKRIDAILRFEGEEIERFHYDNLANIFLDENKLFFPGNIYPLNLFNEIEYWVNDITKITRKRPEFKESAILLK